MCTSCPRPVQVGDCGMASCYATNDAEVRCAGHSHYEDERGRARWGSYPDHREVFYGATPTAFRVVLPAGSTR